MTQVLDASVELARLIRLNVQHILRDWRKGVNTLSSAKGLDTPTLNDHIPDFLGELASTFENSSDASIASRMAHGTPPAHGLERLRNGFEVEEVVAEYNILRECIHDLADRNGLVLQGKPFHILNRALDGAIGAAVRQYATQQALEVQQRRHDYLAFITHDLRTPLNAISLAALMLENMAAVYPDADRASRTFKTLHRNAGYLNTLVNKVLEENANLHTEVSVKVERRRFDLWPLVESLVYDLHPVAGTGSTTLINAIPDDLTIYADAALLRRVFQNLIANAFEHAPSGQVIISACRSASGNDIECSVSDNGIGIADDRLSLIFAKYQSDGETKLTRGLGLAICKAFVEAHGGAIRAESTIGQGSVFTFTIPQAEASQPVPQ
jgi:signal transduction histidine kinase